MYQDLSWFIVYSSAIDNANATTIDDAVEFLTEHGFRGIAKAIEILMYEAMKLERNEGNADTRLCPDFVSMALKGESVSSLVVGASAWGRSRPGRY